MFVSRIGGLGVIAIAGLLVGAQPAENFEKVIQAKIGAQKK